MLFLELEGLCIKSLVILQKNILMNKVVEVYGIKYKLPELPKKESIDNYDLPKEEQKLLFR